MDGAAKVLDNDERTSPEVDCAWQELERSAALHTYEMLDTPRERDFDELATIAAKICETPIAVVNLVDTHRQFFKAEVGLGVRETPLATGFCQHAILAEDILIISDATNDSRFDGNPLVHGEPHLRAYAGALLKTAEGFPIGTVCVLDYKPREFTPNQIEMLSFLARQAMAQFDLRKKVAEQRILLQRARAAEREKANFERVVKQASDFIGIADTRGRVLFLNDAARELIGIEQILQTSIWDYISEEDHQLFREDVLPVIRRGDSCERELRIKNLKTGAVVPAIYSVFPIRNDHGVLQGYGVVTRDISEQKAEEQRRTQMMAEAAHRIKNTLAVVQAIVSQTLKNTTDPVQSRENITKRLTALAAAQDVLISAEGSAADIIDIVTSAMAPHDCGNGRITLNGPSRALTSAQGLGLSLALHELATNAAKYGALSGDAGTVKIEWRISDEGQFGLDWTEIGGPTVAVPTSTGFGSRLVQRMVAPYFRGNAELSFPPEGARFKLTGVIEDVLRRDQ